MIRWTDLTKFIKANAGKSALAPFTGQDYRALFAFAALCDCYAAADDPARAKLMHAMHLTLQCMQESTRPIAKWAIPFALDWSHTDELWKRVGSSVEEMMESAETFEREANGLRR